MNGLDSIKIYTALFGYLVAAPLLGYLISRDRRLQSWTFGLLVFLASCHINKITFMIDSIEWYRGATKGFEVSLLIVVALALLIGQALGGRISRPWLAPGAALYLLYVAASLVSIFAAPDKTYVWMATLRFFQPVIIYMAAFHFFQDADDLRFLMKSLVVTLCIQMVVVVKMKYLNHIYQVMGWFEHQNALAMWAYMCGLPLLAMALGPSSGRDACWCWVGYTACAVIVESALARASLVAFALGSILVVLFSLCDRVTLRRLIAPTIMGLIGIVGIGISFNTILHRFEENRNQASYELRLRLVETSKLMLRDSPIGVGWNNYALVANPPWHYADVLDNWDRSRGNSVNPAETRPQPESLYWLILAETGYPGFVTYMLFLGVTLWWSLRAAWHYRRTLLGAFLIGLSVALVLTYCHSTVERVLTQTKNLAMWLLFLGIVARLRSNMAPPSSFLPAARHNAAPEHFIPAGAAVAPSAG